MPWIATPDNAEKPRMTTRLAIENHRNHPRIATAASTIATLISMPHHRKEGVDQQTEAVRRDQSHPRPAQAPVLRISPRPPNPEPEGNQQQIMDRDQQCKGLRKP